MKLLLAWLAAFAVTSLMWVSCSVPHKSGEFECSTQVDCAELPGRVCSGGFCVTTAPGDARPIDASLPPDGPGCPPGCSSCNRADMKCTINCAQTNCVNTSIVCPAGWSCDIDCSSPNSCRNGIDCTDATACTILCTGQGSCRNVECGEGRCQLSCSGANSCRDVSCSNSCACNIACSAAADCSGVSCSAVQCETTSGGCTSQRQGCNTCP